MLYLRLKLLLYRFYSSELWSKWDIVAADNTEFLAKHKKKCDEILGSIPGEERVAMMKFLAMKIKYLQRKSASRMNKKDRQWVDARLFQALLEHNQVKAVHERMKIKQKLAKK